MLAKVPIPAVHNHRAQRGPSAPRTPQRARHRRQQFAERRFVQAPANRQAGLRLEATDRLRGNRAEVAVDDKTEAAYVQPLLQSPHGHPPVADPERLF
jgi:hypothetical protein